MRSWLLLLLWLVAAASFVAWSAQHTFHVGRMVLPHEQAVAIALVLVTALSLLAAWLGLGVRAAARRLGLTLTPSWLDRRAVRLPLLACLCLAPLGLLYARYLEPRWVVTREVTLGGSPPAGQERVRLAVISDLHIDGAGEPWRALPARVNATRPDLILLLGDTLNRPAGLGPLRRLLGALRAPRGKLAVRGNWETWYWRRLPLLEGTGFRWLDGQAVTVRARGQTLHLVGFPYGDLDPVMPARRLLRPRSDGGWRVLLYHTPDLVERVSADLYLAGHTHGGQIALPGFGALVTLSRYGKRYERGLTRVGRTTLYVNPGIGVEPLIPLRLGVRPEVTLLQLGVPPRAARPREKSAPDDERPH